MCQGKVWPSGWEVQQFYRLRNSVLCQIRRRFDYGKSHQSGCLPADVSTDWKKSKAATVKKDQSLKNRPDLLYAAKDSTKHPPRHQLRET